MHHVRVGEDVAVGTDDEARTERLGLELTRSRLGHEAPKELVERVILLQVRHLRQQRAAHRLGGADVNDGRTLSLHEIGEIRQLGHDGHGHG